MKQSEAINAIIKASFRTQEYVGARMNPPMKQSAVARVLNNGNMTVNRLWEMCEILGYEIVLQPKGNKPKPGQVIVDGETKADRAKKLNTKKDGAENVTR